MDNESLRRRLRREHFDVIGHDPQKAHRALDTMMREVLVSVQNNRHVPDELRENARVLRTAWDVEWAEREAHAEEEQFRMSPAILMELWGVIEDANDPE